MSNKIKAVYQLNRDVVTTARRSVYSRIVASVQARECFNGNERKDHHDYIRQLIRTYRDLIGYAWGLDRKAVHAAVSRGLSKKSKRLLRQHRREQKRLATPLFIPLKAVYFEQFKAGTKTTEYRRRSKVWCIENCPVGRPVILSRGYSGERLTGKIVGCHYDHVPSRLPGWVECYGQGGTATCIKIELDSQREVQS